MEDSSERDDGPSLATRLSNMIASLRGSSTSTVENDLPGATSWESCLCGYTP